MDDKAFREAFTQEMTEYVKEAEAAELVELYNKFSQNEVSMSEDSFTIKTPETTQIIADAEKAEAPEEEVIADDSQAKRNMNEPHRGEDKADDEKDKDEEDDEEDDTAGEVPMLDKDFDEGEEVELEIPAEDKFTNDLDPADKK